MEKDLKKELEIKKMLENLESIDLLQDRPKESMEITRCPHKNRRHYAKVSSNHLIKSYRTCVPHVTGSMEELSMLQSVNTKIS